MTSETQIKMPTLIGFYNLSWFNQLTLESLTLREVWTI